MTRTIKHFTDYAAAPDDDAFEPIGLDGLREILAELEAISPTERTENDDMDMILLIDTVIPAAENGAGILSARDQDGYYFARISR